MIIKMFCLVAQANTNHTIIFLTKAKKSKGRKCGKKQRWRFSTATVKVTTSKTNPNEKRNKTFPTYCILIYNLSFETTVKLQVDLSVDQQVNN